MAAAAPSIQQESPRMRTNRFNDAANPTRRDFMKASTAAAVSAAAIATIAFPSGVRAAGSDELKLGLVGCGGRGSGAAVNALNADSNAKIVALGDAFPDKVEKSLDALSQSEVGDRVDVPDDNKFSGFDAYKGVIEKCDVVLLATPPYFRPMHLRAAIEAGKHVFCEKPVAVDTPGVKDVMESCRLAKEKNLSVLSGLCFRYNEAVQDVIKRVHDGAVGDIRMISSNYLTGGLWSNPRKPGWSDMEWQVRNWLYFHWLSGDHVVEQHVHSLDKMMWVMKDAPPLKVNSTGGRIQRTQPQYGNIYDHFTNQFEWADGVRAITQSRQFVDCDTDVSDTVYGSKGVASIMNFRITGATEWSRKKSPMDMYDAEHVVLFNAIRKNQPINNGDYMTKSTLAAIMARESAYTGRTMYWDKAAAEASGVKEVKPDQLIMESTTRLGPTEFKWGDYPAPAVVVPGVKQA
jgi:predicted dehydrogenase